MWTLYREVADQATYNTIIAQDPSVEFDYFIDTDANLAGAVKLESAIDWDKHWSETDEQYGIARQKIHEILHAKGWDNMSTEERFVAIKYRAYPNTETSAAAIVGWLVSVGYTPVQAQGFLLKSGAEELSRLIRNCQYRGSHTTLWMIIGMYLSLTDQIHLNELVDGLLGKYSNKAIRGINYGSPDQAALFDFIEGTAGTQYETTNLMSQGYTMQNGDPDASNLVAALIAWLHWGYSPFN